MKQLLALAGALAMITAALIARGTFDDDGPGTAREGGGDRGERTIACPPDLAAACEALPGVTVRIEPAGTTADALRSATLDPAIDGWLVPSVWVDVVASGAPDALDGRGTLVASSPVVLAVDPDRVDAVRSLCDTGPVLACVGDAAGSAWGELGGDARWGALRVGLPDVDRGTGLAALASVATAYFASQGIDRADFAAQDFDVGFRPWLTRLAATRQPGDVDPLRTLVTTRGAYTAAATIGADAAGRRVELLVAEPLVEAEITLVAVATGGGVPDPGPARAALVDAGWEPAEGPTPASAYLPGVLAALRSTWSEVSR